MNTNRPLLWIALAGLPVALVAIGLSGCGGDAKSQEGQGKKPDVRVDVSLPVKDVVVDYEEFTGRVDAANKAGLQAMVTGYLDRVHFKDGDDVAKDEVLFEIDPRTFQAAYNMAAASVEQTKARFQRLTYDLERGKSLVKDGSLARQDFDLIVGDRLEAQANADQARANLEKADVNLKYTKVRAPWSGRLSRRLIDPGNMVKANETMLTWIYQIDPMYGYFDVDERTVIKLRKLVNEGTLKSYRDYSSDDKNQMWVDIGLADEEGFSQKGFVNWVDNVVDGGTGTLKVRTAIYQPKDPSTGKAQVLLSPGMFVRMRLPTSAEHKAVLISEKAIGTDQGEKYVLIVTAKKDDKGNTIHVVDRRNVTLGQMQRGLRVVEKNPPDKGKDLLPSDRVIVSGLQRVKKDDKVAPTVIAMPGYYGPVQVQVQAPAPLLNSALPIGKSGN
jgi:multidrug efflux system membrane fusion protein